MVQIVKTAYKLIVAFSVLFLLAGDIQAQRRKKKKQKAPDPVVVLENNLKQHIYLLASDSLEGRRTGTPGEQKAVDYIAAQYTAMQMEPAGNEGYFQKFEIDEGRDFKKNSTLAINDAMLEPGSDYFPFAWSANGSIRSNATLALHESGDVWWTDINPIREKNKENPHFILAAYLKEVAEDAANKGATGIIFYNSADQNDSLSFLPKDGATAISIPAVYINHGLVEKWKLDQNSSPFITGSIQLEQVKRTGTNVVAKINNGAPYTIVVGAHLDHLGYGEDHNSRYTGTPSIHNGADDNASGTASVMEIARFMKEKGSKQFNYVFVHFSGEELGLTGSKYFVEHPTLDLSTVSYMVNLDMVGRFNDSSKALTIGGFGTSPSWPALVMPNAGFTFKIDSSGTGPSDHTSFYRKDIPVLFFFTGLHTDYHKPSDDADKINYHGMAVIIQYIENLVQTSPADQKLAFAKTKEQSTGGRGFKVSVGIMPDYTFSGTGVKADGVIEGRPAQKAGMVANDIILQLGDILITGIDMYMQALNRFEKGQSTTITVKRGNEIKEFPITF